MNSTTPAPEPLDPMPMPPLAVELRGMYADVATIRGHVALRPLTINRFEIFAAAFVAAHPGRGVESVSAIELAEWWVTL